MADLSNCIIIKTSALLVILKSYITSFLHSLDPVPLKKFLLPLPWKFYISITSVGTLWIYKCPKGGTLSVGGNSYPTLAHCTKTPTSPRD